MRKIKFSLLVLALLLLVGCSSKSDDIKEKSESNTRIVTDMKGYKVEIPAKVGAYVESWAAHITIDVMLDHAENMVAMCVPIKEGSIGALITPKLSTVQATEFSDQMNLEEIIALKPDVVFGKVESYREIFENVGIPFVNVDFYSFDTMVQSINLVAEVLGGDAIQTAEEYEAYLRKSIDLVAEKVSDIPISERVSIAHGHPAYELLIDGSNTIIDEWINYSGCINAAAEDVNGQVQAVTLEMMYKWDPDVIISGDPKSDVESILSDPAWANLTAVKNGKVLTNPKGIFMWDRYGIEEALQVQWCASTMYPELFEDFDIREEVKWFYREFLDYELSDELVELFMTHETEL